MRRLPPADVAALQVDQSHAIAEGPAVGSREEGAIRSHAEPDARCQQVGGIREEGLAAVGGLDPDDRGEAVEDPGREHQGGAVGRELEVEGIRGSAAPAEIPTRRERGHVPGSRVEPEHPGVDPVGRSGQLDRRQVHDAGTVDGDPLEAAELRPTEYGRLLSGRGIDPDHDVALDRKDRAGPVDCVVEEASAREKLVGPGRGVDAVEPLDGLRDRGPAHDEVADSEHDGGPA